MGSSIRIDNFQELKNDYEIVYNEIAEIFLAAHKKLKSFELDYFVLDKETDKFYASLSSGISDDLETFDIHGELIDDEICVFDSSFSNEYNESEDLYDSDGYKRESYEDDYDSDY